MKKVVSMATAVVMAAALSPAAVDTWTGKLVDAACKASDQGKDLVCTATPATHLFAIELPDAKVLNLNAAGNEKVALAVMNSRETNLRVTITGSLEEQFLNVETIEIINS
jgi:alcohol dehydrogenase YqhD (iron-dependent ADH family)